MFKFIEILRENLGKTLCRLGCHIEQLRDKENNHIKICTRPGCAWSNEETEKRTQKMYRDMTNEATKHLKAYLDEEAENLKMYVLICNETPADIAPLVAAHTTVGTYLRFKNRIDTDTWSKTELKKTVVCKATRQQFERAKYYGEYFALTEIHHKEMGELGLGFNVYHEYPKFFKFLPLYKV